VFFLGMDIDNEEMVTALLEEEVDDVADGNNFMFTNSLGLQVESVVASIFSPQGDSKVYIELSGSWLEVDFFFSSSSNLQSKVFVLCSQLHRVVVKHKVSY
jgi:hypothetical protein